MLLAAGLVLLAAIALPAIGAHAQQQAVTDGNLAQMIADAKTPADHEAIAEYYDKEAAADDAKAKLHHAVHHEYEKFHLKPPEMVEHCDELAESFQRAAEQDRALAAAHRAIAKKLEPIS
jgi:hypothetical protein